MGQYRFAYHPENVYGYVVRLVSRHAPVGGVHLDIGCGFGAIAEPLAGLGFTYIGVDIDEESLTDLRQRGFETISCDLSQPDVLVQKLAGVIGGRTVVAITMLDIIEHVVDPAPMVDTVHDIAMTHGSILVTSVPNAGHHDLGVKLLTGRWDYTPTGLLDQTHVRFFTHHSLERLMTHCGWDQIDAHDFLLEPSDQGFPRESVVLSRSTTVGQVLRGLSSGAGKYSGTNQFIRAYRPVTPQPVPLLSDRSSTRRYAMSVIIRAEAGGEQAFRDHMAELGAQTSDDFEVIICMPESLEKVVSDVVGDLHNHLRGRVSSRMHAYGSGCHALREAIGSAAGKYVAVLEASGRVLAHWIEAFVAVMDEADGRVIQAGAAHRSSQPVMWAGEAGRHSPGLPSACPAFDPVFGRSGGPIVISRHAVPWHFFSEMGERLCWSGYDIVAEIIASASVWCGVFASGEMTSIEHDVESDQARADRVVMRLDSFPLILPPGSLAQIRRRVVEHDTPDDTDRQQCGYAARIAVLEDRNRRLAEVVAGMRQSRSWRVTGPLRGIVSLARRLLRR